jgi:hypothetical protein
MRSALENRSRRPSTDRHNDDEWSAEVKFRGGEAAVVASFGANADLPVDDSSHERCTWICQGNVGAAG